MEAYSEDMESLINKTRMLQCVLEDVELIPDSRNAKKVADLSLVGKIISNRTFGKNVVTAILRKAWNVSKTFQVNVLQSYTFLFEFEHNEDRKKVLQRGPWNINGSHLVLKKWDFEKTFEEANFKSTAFWVQIHGLPLLYITKENALKIGERIGKVLKVDFNNDDRVINRSFLRVWVEVDVEKPLMAGFFHKKSLEQTTWIQFKYDRISKFCFKCGRLGHLLNDCIKAEEVITIAPNGSSTINPSKVANENQGRSAQVNKVECSNKIFFVQLMNDGDKLINKIDMEQEVIYVAFKEPQVHQKIQKTYWRKEGNADIINCNIQEASLERSYATRSEIGMKEMAENFKFHSNFLQYFPNKEMGYNMECFT
ncbi:hypothetical protein FEM48_Zijuj05G0059400 [Ziziphus jujuba var. spinosa]|uniref:CCHC-type domain-containing protein n=1 Tax=Ziziphus jujuba var. spinosa TaxID=714518 RepID=A0A978VD73_ZIZJJ|nr:hypothetical protein FEM48_Zijuj05G0059400 [Ziziphus jujuba var. spinosa]